MKKDTDELKQIHVKLEADLHQALKLEAVFYKTTIQELVVDLIKKRISDSEFSNMVKSNK